MPEKPPLRNTSSAVHTVFFRQFANVIGNISMRGVIHEAGAVALFATTLLIRILIFPFQAVIFIADFVIAAFTLTVVALVLGLAFGYISPEVAANRIAIYLNHATEHAIVSGETWAAKHPDTTLGRLVLGRPAGVSGSGRDDRTAPTTRPPYRVTPAPSPAAGFPANGKSGN